MQKENRHTLSQCTMLYRARFIGRVKDALWVLTAALVIELFSASDLKLDATVLRITFMTSFFVHFDLKVHNRNNSTQYCKSILCLRYHTPAARSVLIF